MNREKSINQRKFLVLGVSIVALVLVLGSAALAGQAGDARLSTSSTGSTIGVASSSPFLNANDFAGVGSQVSEVGVGQNPYQIAVNPNTDLIYTVNRGSNSTTVIDGENDEVVATISTPAAHTGIAVDPTTNLVYVTAGGGDIYVINGSSNNVIATINTGETGLENIAVNPVTNTIYVDSQIGQEGEDHGVIVIDGTTNSVTTVINQLFGYNSLNLAVDSNTDMLYVVGDNYIPTATIGPTGFLIAVNGSTNTVSSILQIGQQYDVAINPTTNTIYTSNGDISVINGSTDAVIDTISQANVTFIGIAVNPATGELYSSTNDSSIYTFNGSTDAIIQKTSVQVTGGPNYLAIDPVTGVVYTSDSNSSYISVLPSSVQTTTTTSLSTNSGQTNAPGTAGTRLGAAPTFEATALLNGNSAIVGILVTAVVVSGSSQVLIWRPARVVGPSFSRHIKRKTVKTSTYMIHNKSGTKILIVLIAALIIMMPLLQIGPVKIQNAEASSGHTSTGILEPAYWSVDSCSGCYTDVIDAHNAYPSVPYFVVINPDDGPCGSSYAQCGDDGNNGSADTAYYNEVKTLVSDGIKVFGYIPTGWCVETGESGNTLSLMEDWIATYSDWYGPNSALGATGGLTGIFLDQMSTASMSTDCSAGTSTYPQNFYSILTTDANVEGFNYVIGNPGTDTSPSYISTVNTLNIFEANASVSGSGNAVSVSTLNENNATGCTTPSGVTGWHLCYNKSNFSFTQYGATSLPSSSTIQQLSNYVGLMFFTNQGCGKPTECTIGSPNNGDDAYGVSPTQTYLEDELSPLDTASAILTVDSTNSYNGSVVGVPMYFFQTSDNCVAYPTTCGEIMQGDTASPVSGGSASIAVNGTEGWRYEVRLGAVPAGCTFDEWSNGSTSTSISVVLTTSKTITAEFTGSSCGSSVTVNSVNQYGDGISGYDFQLIHYGTLITSGFTNGTLGVNDGTEYTVFPQNYETCSFSHWQDTGNIYAERGFSATDGNIAFTAVYWCAPSGSTSVTIQTSYASGVITGYNTILYTSGGTEISSGFSTYTYTGLSGSTGYQVAVQNYDGCDFSQWNSTGSTSDPLSFTGPSTGNNLLLDASYTGSCL